MKKLFCFIIAFISLFALTGCNEKNEKERFSFDDIFENDKKDNNQTNEIDYENEQININDYETGHSSSSSYGGSLDIDIFDNYILGEINTENFQLTNTDRKVFNEKMRSDAKITEILLNTDEESRKIVVVLQLM